MKYRQISESESRFPISKLCDVLGVSRSGYYAWKYRPESLRSTEDKQLLMEIREIHRQSEETYGSPRVHAELQDMGVRCGQNRVARIMQENKVVSIHRKKYQVTTNSNHKLTVAENLLDRDFVATDVNQKWVGDITYIPTRQGWLYLAVVMDLFSRQIVGWSMQETLSKDIALDALQMALDRRGVSPELFHSDRGIQYASGSYQQKLESEGIVCSMSRKANCWDNAVSESFFHSLKVERVHRRRYANRAHARVDIFDYIERFYNRFRRHSSIGYKSPAAFEEARIAA